MSGEIITTPIGGNALSTQIFGHNAADDFKDMGQSDIILRRLRLAQSMLQVVKDGKAKLGDWVIAETGDVVFPQTGGNVIPIGWFKEWIEWNPDKLDKTKKILNRSADASTEVGKKLSNMAATFTKIMTKKGEVLRVTEYFNFLVLIPEFTGNYSDYFVLSFGRTGHKIGKQWLNKLRNRKLDVPYAGPDGTERMVKVESPIYACQWQIDSKPEVNKEGEEYLVPVIGNGEQLPADYWPELRIIAENFKASRARFVEAASEANAVEAEGEVVEPAKESREF